VKKLFVATIILMAGAMSGCSSMNMSSNSMPLTAPVEANVKADIQVGEKITGQSSVTKVLFFTLGDDKEYADGITYGGSSGSSFPFGDPVADAKAAAAYKAVKSSGADVIVLPRYTVKKQDYLLFSKIDVMVEGFKGTIKSVK
jgi:ABC-type Fe3+-hydroxamate transport system substrate-binding protein